MSHPTTPRRALPCLWMSAGLLTYKLCDREHDCEHCPLDAALRGSRPAPAAEAPLSDPGRRAVHFPQDRLYTTGHTWIGPGARETGHRRFGVDGFAAALLGAVLQVGWPLREGPAASGQAICELDLAVGLLPLASPVDARLVARNSSLDADPGLLIADPYGQGWLLELEIRTAAPAEGLLSPEEARRQATLDLSLFRHRAGVHLLAGPAEVGPTLADGGEPLTDLRRILGSRRYLELLRELIH